MPLNRSCNRRHHNATAVTELAIVLPVILLITVGILSICEGFFLKQKLTLAAHEGARIAIRRDAKQANIEQAVARYLDARGIQYDSIGSVLSVSPSAETAQQFQPITVEVTVDFDPNSRLPMSLSSVFNGASVSADVTMFKEFENGS